MVHARLEKCPNHHRPSHPNHGLCREEHELLPSMPTPVHAAYSDTGASRSSLRAVPPAPGQKPSLNKSWPQRGPTFQGERADTGVAERQPGIGWDTRSHELACTHTGHPSASRGSGPILRTAGAYSHSPGLAKMAEGKARQSSSCSRARAGLLPGLSHA